MTKTKGFIALCDEFPGFSAFGETREEALTEAHIALSLTMEHYEETGQKLPAPHSFPIVEYPEPFNYTNWRKTLFAGMSIEKISAEAMANWENEQNADAS